MGDRPPFPFVVGCGRSGTTLLRAMLDSHPELAIPGEANFVAILAGRRARYTTAAGFDTEQFAADVAGSVWYQRWGQPADELRAAVAAPPIAPGDFGEAVRRVFKLYADSQNKPRYGDKTPRNVLHLPVIGDLFPEARAVHVVRDGRDVVLSLREQEFAPDALADATLYWHRRVEAGRSAGEQLGPARYREVRYEELVDDPERVLRDLCGFLALDYDSAMLRYPERFSLIVAADGSPTHFANVARPPTRGLRDWRTTMPTNEVALFEALAGDALSLLGYERAVARPTAAVRARVAAVRARRGASAGVAHFRGRRGRRPQGDDR